MWQNLRFSVRTLARSPLFTVAAVLSLALAIGANTAIFSLVDQVLLRMLPVRDPASLVLLHREYQPQGTSTSDNFESVFSYPMYRQLRDHAPSFSGVVARMSSEASIMWRGSTEMGNAEMVSGNFFGVLGVDAAMGRVLVPNDDGAPGAHPVVVLSHSYWSSRFGNNRSLLNQTISVNGHPMVVVGVTAARFNGVTPGHMPDVYVPIAMVKTIKPTWNTIENAEFRWLSIFARLKPGVSARRAQASTDVVYHSLLEAELAAMGKVGTARGRKEFLNHKVELRPASQGINALRRNWNTPLVALMAMVGLVLLIACANVAGLMLARATGRQREIAIRLAMGASRWELVKQLLLEGFVLSLAGGVLGLAVAVWSAGGLFRILPDDFSKWFSAGIDLRILAFNLTLSVASGLFFGLIPALQATRPNLAGTLKDQATSVASGGGAARFRQALVTAQVALSVLLVVGAGLFTGSLINLLKENLGFRTERLLAFRVNAALSRPDMASALAFYRELQDRLANIGGVTGVAASDAGPFSDSNHGANITVEGYHAKEDEDVDTQFGAVSPGFFHALGIPLRAGREISARDTAAAPKVVVVSEGFARRFFGNQSPVGRRMMFGGSNHPVLDREIVGVVADIRRGVRDADKVFLYYPFEQSEKPDALMFYVRTVGDPGHIAPDIRQLARAIDAGVPLDDIKPMDLRIRESIYSDRLIAMLAGAFGVLATLLAAIGLYGIVSYTVARRTSEIGIRMALGALPRDVLGMVLLEAFKMAGAGIAIGIVGAIALGKLVQSQLFGLQAANPAILAAAAGLLAAIALTAAFVPGWRASRIDPVTALKYE